MRGLLSHGANLVALCDPDQEMINKAREDALSAGGDATKSAKAYEDYRQLLDNPASFDAVLVGTPDHWHAPLCKAFMKSGKHVYCEKPLTHSVAEARELRELARTSGVVTQMGNQGSASDSLRRCTEIIRAGRWARFARSISGVSGSPPMKAARRERSVPPGFNWDLWVGPSALRPYKKEVYHPFRWRGWFDFGNGGLADFCCHAINLPMRALDLGYPDQIVVNMQNGQQIADKAAVEFHFPARGDLQPVTLYWQGNGTPPAEVLQPLVDIYKDKAPDGPADRRREGLHLHESLEHGGPDPTRRASPACRTCSATKARRTFPRPFPAFPDHGKEWIDACRGQGSWLPGIFFKSMQDFPA